MLLLDVLGHHSKSMSVIDRQTDRKNQSMSVTDGHTHRGRHWHIPHTETTQTRPCPAWRMQQYRPGDPCHHLSCQSWTVHSRCHCLGRWLPTRRPCLPSETYWGMNSHWRHTHSIITSQSLNMETNNSTDEHLSEIHIHRHRQHHHHHHHFHQNCRRQCHHYRRHQTYVTIW